MAPEILENKPYTHKADIYSFGVSIFDFTNNALDRALGDYLQRAAL